MESHQIYPLWTKSSIKNATNLSIGGLQYPQPCSLPSTFDLTFGTKNIESPAKRANGGLPELFSPGDRSTGEDRSWTRTVETHDRFSSLLTQFQASYLFVGFTLVHT